MPNQDCGSPTTTKEVYVRDSDLADFLYLIHATHISVSRTPAVGEWLVTYEA